MRDSCGVSRELLFGSRLDEPEHRIVVPAIPRRVLEGELQPPSISVALRYRGGETHIAVPLHLRYHRDEHSFNPYSVQRFSGIPASRMDVLPIPLF